MELDVLPAVLYFRYRAMFPKAEIVDISGDIKEIRMIKSPYELKIIKKAAELSDRMFEAAPRFLKEGKREIEFAAEVEHFLRSNGHQGGMRIRQFNQECFFGHIMSGGEIPPVLLFEAPPAGEGFLRLIPRAPDGKD